MGFQCCICHEDLSKKKHNDIQETSKQEPTVVTTKCGHLYHSECLSSWFEKKGKQAWTTRECPVCRMELTVATDVIRIFFPFNSPEEGLTTEDYKSRIDKLEKANQELAIRLEQTFLLGREQDKKIHALTIDKERLHNAYIIERSKAAQAIADSTKLKLDNEELKTVIIDLNIKAMSNGANGINMGGMPHMMPPSGFMPPRYPDQMMAVGPRPGNINLFNNYPHPPGMPGPGHMMGRMIEHGYSAKHGSQSNLAPGGEIVANGSNRPNHKTDSETLSSQLSNLLLHREPPNNSNSAEPKPLLNGISETNDSSPNSISGTQLNEAGDIRQSNTLDIRSIESGHLPLKESNLNANNPRMNLSYASKIMKPLENGYSVSNQPRTSMSDAPTDELMDEILRAAPKTVPPNDKQSQNSDARVITVSNENYRSKGKTKWKPIGYEDEKKLYGKFYCKTCGAKWGTPRHILNEPQNCQKCGDSTFPYAQGPVMSKEELAMDKINRQRQQ